MRHFSRFSVVPLALTCLLALFGCGSGLHDASLGVVPAISSVSPEFSVVGSTSQTLTLYGSGFTASSRLLFNGTPRTFSVLSPQQITFSLNATDLSSPGTFQLSVANASLTGFSLTTATFSVWNQYADGATGISLPFPQFSSAAHVESSTSPGAVSSPSVQAWSASAQADVSVLGWQVFRNTSYSSIQQWFAANVDVNGMLSSAGTFQAQQLDNGATALVFRNAVPDAFLSVGAPVQEIYAMTEDGKYVITLTEGQEGQVSDYGYDSSVLLPQIIGAAHF